MKTIPQDTLLETEEVHELLKGRIKLENFVQSYELRGLAKGYWSNAVIVALDRACGILPVERVQGASEKKGRNQDRRVLGPATTAQLRCTRSSSLKILEPVSVSWNQPSEGPIRLSA
jgi:hypothetical protein